jgi:hypothetical protein
MDHLSLIDCKIVSFVTLLNALQAQTKLKQLIIIFNQEVEQDMDSTDDNESDDYQYHLVRELTTSNLD